MSRSTLAMSTACRVAAVLVGLAGCDGDGSTSGVSMAAQAGGAGLGPEAEPRKVSSGAEAGSGGRAGAAQPASAVGAAGSGSPGGTSSGVPRPAAGSSASPASGGAAAPAHGSAAGSAGGDAARDMGMIEGKVTVIATTQLSRPTDLEWNPYVNDELWVMNHGDSSAAIISHASAETRSVQRRLDPEGARHFMPQPMAFAFGARETTLNDAQSNMVEGTFATCPEDSTSYMGPSLWTSDLRIFAITKAEREPPFNGADTGAEGPGSHLDMLHRTPTCAGMAWEGAGNVYWTYAGRDSMFVKYDFELDHGIGNTDHSDGSVWRYPIVGVRYLSGIPSHLEFEPTKRLLYMADSGNGRVVTFDPQSATEMSPMSVSENVDRLEVAQDLSGGKLVELVPASYGMLKPSGLEIHAGALYVSDNETGIIHKFGLDGAPLGKVHIPGIKRAALSGLAVGPDAKLYFVDMVDQRVLRLDEAF